MKFVITAPGGKRICTWGSYALLRDNVQHFIEQGQPSARFKALHDIERAVDRGSSRVPAARLRGEVLRAWCALWHVDLESAAISLRTRAVLTQSSALPGARDTVEAKAAGWELPRSGSGRTPLPKVAFDFVKAVMALTETAVDGDVLEIRAIGARPRYVASFDTGAELGRAAS